MDHPPEHPTAPMIGNGPRSDDAHDTRADRHRPSGRRVLPARRGVWRCLVALRVPDAGRSRLRVRRRRLGRRRRCRIERRSRRRLRRRGRPVVGRWRRRRRRSRPGPVPGRRARRGVERRGRVLARDDRRQRGGARGVDRAVQRQPGLGHGRAAEPAGATPTTWPSSARPPPTTGPTSCSSPSTRCGCSLTRGPRSRRSRAWPPTTTLTSTASSTARSPTTRSTTYCRSCRSTSRTPSSTTTG